LEFKNFAKDLKDFAEQQKESGKEVKIYRRKEDPFKFFKKLKIDVGLESNKKIVLQEETKLELGGVNKNSFSIVHLTHEIEYVEDGKIMLLGLEINELKELNVDFGIFVLIGVKQDLTEEVNALLTHLNFISNGIEGFSIRSIPRRFWCRISEKVVNKGFSFEFLGNAIMYLYKEKFKAFIDSIEIFFVNYYADLMKEFIKLISVTYDQIREKWKNKIEAWKKKVDCNYDWGCEICPFQVECNKIKEVLVEREILDGKIKS